MFCALYLTAYLDRTNIGDARLLGLEDEFGMLSKGYNTAVWVIHRTFVLMELCVSMTLLGIVIMCQRFTQRPGQVHACRAIMGIFDGSLGPAAALMMWAYYRKHEFALRHTCFTTSALVRASFSSFLAYAINFMDGFQGISWIFDIAVASLTFFVLVQFPAESNFLNPNEKASIRTRVSFLSN
ncbi:hypothetical protein BJY01DRAFT_253045 [Aspergillus pseudoustus]|uniref:Major facilitator superfamily domain-containing protein n=1 Tax=Aspergillus pseudoustus TaxID=1810923 RepID=A0ABR4J681_9EURO